MLVEHVQRFLAIRTGVSRGTSPLETLHIREQVPSFTNFRDRLEVSIRETNALGAKPNLRLNCGSHARSIHLQEIHCKGKY